MMVINALIVLLGWLGESVGPPWATPVFGLVPDDTTGETVIVAVGRRAGDPAALDGPALLRGTVGDAERDPRPPVRYATHVGSTADWSHRAFRVAIADGRLWQIGHRIGESMIAVPLEDIAAQEASGWGRLIERHRKVDWSKHEVCLTAQLLFPYHRFDKPDFEPVPPLRQDDAGGDHRPEYAKVAWWDAVPSGKNYVRLYHASKQARKLFVSTENPWVAAKNKVKEGEVPLRDLIVAVLPEDFAGPFHAHRSGKADYLLTADGRLFVVRKSKDGWEVAAIWSDKRRPLAGAVQDVASGKVFAFGFEEGWLTGRRFYFELAEQPKPVSYNRSSLLRSSEDAYFEVIACRVAENKSHSK